MPSTQKYRRTTDINCQLLEGRAIGLRTNSQHDTHRQASGQDLLSHEFPKTSFYQVARYRGMLEPWNDDSYARAVQCMIEMRKRGNGHPNLDMRGSNALPLLSDAL